jgi:hypothetical protein
VKNTQEEIAKTLFLTSVTSYGVFWVCDALRPGFVARYVSVHLFLLVAVASGAWWAMCVRACQDWPLLQYVVAGLVGLGVTYFVWSVGESFGDVRVLASGLAFFVPLVSLLLVRTS